MSGQSIYQQSPVRHPLLYGDAGGRFRKDLSYCRNYQPELRPTLESADVIAIVNQQKERRFFMIDPFTKPMQVAARRKCVAVKWTNALPILVGNATPGRNAIDFTELNAVNGEMILWKIYALSPNFMFDIEQPGSAPINTNGSQLARLHYGNTGYYAKKNIWGAVPEVAVIEDKTPVGLNIYPTNMNEQTFIAYVGYEGYRYRLIYVDVDDPEDEPRVVQTITVSAMV